MNETNKLLEAQYFLKQLHKNSDDIEAFSYNLSAFLSASRSVLQYAFKEVKEKKYQSWYENAMKNSKTFQYFKDKRDISIHVIPIRPSEHVEIITEEVISVTVTNYVVSLKRVDEDGKLIEEESTKKEKPTKEKKSETPKPQSRGATIDREFVFVDFNGSHKNILELCKEYLDELELFIEQGKNLGCITG